MSMPESIAELFVDNGITVRFRVIWNISRRFSPLRGVRRFPPRVCTQQVTASHWTRRVCAEILTAENLITNRTDQTFGNRILCSSIFPIAIFSFRSVGSYRASEGLASIRLTPNQPARSTCVRIISFPLVDVGVVFWLFAAFFLWLFSFQSKHRGGIIQRKRNVRESLMARTLTAAVRFGTIVAALR